MDNTKKPSESEALAMRRAKQRRKQELSAIYESWTSDGERADLIRSMDEGEIADVLGWLVASQIKKDEKLDQIIKALEDLPFEKKSRDDDY